MSTRLNVSLTTEELNLLKQVAAPRKLSAFIKEAAVARAQQVQRERLRQSIVQAYEADPDFVKAAGREWDEIAHQGWPEP